VLGICLGDFCWIHDLDGSSKGDCNEKSCKENCECAEGNEGYDKEANGLAQEGASWLL